jgi:PST family polysaccharide transporter
VARIISLVLSAVVVKGLKLIEKVHRANKKEIANLLKESWPMGVYLLVFASYDRAVDSLMIERLVGIREVAWYGLAYKIYATLLQPAYYFVSSIFPLMSSKITDQKKLMAWSKLMILGVLLVGLPIGYLLAPWMVEVLVGSEFLPSVAIVRILLLAMSFSYINHLLGFKLIANKGQMNMLKIGLTVLVVNIGLNLVLIPIYGISGAAWVTVATEAASFVLVWMNLRKAESVA